MSKEKYDEFIKSVELTNVKLHSLECKQNPTFSSERRKSLNIAFEDSVLEIEYEGVDLNVQIEFNVVAFDSEKEIKGIKDILEEDKLFQISFVLNLTYEIELETVENILEGYKDEVDRFVNNNVPINAWPYARETISSMTTRMGFPPLLIPTFKRLPHF